MLQHILDCHRSKSEVLEPPFSTEQLQRYIRFARAFDPQVLTISKHFCLQIL